MRNIKSSKNFIILVMRLILVFLSIMSIRKKNKLLSNLGKFLNEVFFFRLWSLGLFYINILWRKFN